MAENVPKITRKFIEGRLYLVDESTGEIFNYSPDSPYTQRLLPPITDKEYSLLYPPIITPPRQARSVDDIDKFIKQSVDRRKLVIINNLLETMKEDAGLARINGTPHQMTLTQYKLLVPLTQAVRIHNVVVGTQADIADILSIKVNHLKRTLKTLSPYVKVEDVGLMSGMLRLIISPDIIYVAEKGKVASGREQALADFYKVEETYQEKIARLCEPNNIPEVDIPIEERTYAGMGPFSKAFIKELDGFKSTIRGKAP